MPRLNEEDREEITASLYGAKEYLIRAQETAAQKGAMGLVKKIESMHNKVDLLYRKLMG